MKVKCGFSVGPAGDVNGDGYADVIVGAETYDNGQPDEGRAFVYYGNGGAGLALRPRQLRTDGSAQIAPLGKSDSATSAQLRLTGRTPLGREQVKLHWQVAPLGTPFTATAIISGTSATWTDVLTTGVIMTQNVTGLTANTPYHWRVRLLYRPGNRLGQSASHWIHIPWNSWNEQDFRTAGSTTITLTTSVIAYTYDPLYRLTNANYSGAYTYTFAYRYDAVGNRVIMTETVNSTVVTTYTYNAANQLVNARSSEDGITWYYTFDGNGNLTEVIPNGTTPAAGALRYTYDQASRLTTVENHNGSAYQPQASMVYDGAGQRLRITAWQGGLSITSTYVVDSLARGTVLAATANGQTTYYLYGYDVIAEQTSAWAYYLKDGQATVRQLTDATAAVMLLRSYDPFGQVLVQEGTGNLAWGYFGGLLDAATGLIYFGNGLYYDPVTGRFLTPGGNGQNPYVPVGRGDPLGAMLGPVAVLALLARRRQTKGKSSSWLLVLIVLVGVSAGLAACVPGPSPTPQPPSTSPTPEPTPTPGPCANSNVDPNDRYCDKFGLGIAARAEQIYAEFLAGKIVIQRDMTLPFDPSSDPRYYVCADVVRDAYASGGLALSTLLKQYLGNDYNQFSDRNAVVFWRYLTYTPEFNGWQPWIHTSEEGFSFAVPGDMVLGNFGDWDVLGDGTTIYSPGHVGIIVSVHGASPEQIWVVQASYSSDKIVRETMTEFMSKAGRVEYGHPHVDEQGQLTGQPLP